MLVELARPELIVPANSLPAGSKAGSWLTIETDGQHLTKVELDQKTTTEREARIKEKMNRLLRKKK